jgi:hypothetical protein
MQEVLLARHARKLLLKKQLKALALYCSIVQRQLRGWMLRERKRAAVVDDLAEALALCHSQFNIPYPTHFPVDFLLNGGSSCAQGKKKTEKKKKKKKRKTFCSYGLRLAEPYYKLQIKQDLL